MLFWFLLRPESCCWLCCLFSTPSPYPLSTPFPHSLHHMGNALVGFQKVLGCMCAVQPASCFFKNRGKIQIRKNLLSYLLLNLKFSSVTLTLLCSQSLKLLSSCKTKTLCPLNNNFPFSPPLSSWQPPFYFMSP